MILQWTADNVSALLDNIGVHYGMPYMHRYI